MEPVSLIVAALAAGALAGSENIATKAVIDAYSGLRTLVRRRFSGRPSGVVAMQQHELKPMQWGPALEAELVEARVDMDTEVVGAAERLMALLDPTGTRHGKYSVDMRGAKGVQLGDNNYQVNKF